jgi:hypothetical protein
LNHPSGIALYNINSTYLPTYNQLKKLSAFLIKKTFSRGNKMKKISYQYLIDELGLTPTKIQEIIIDTQQKFVKNLILIDESFLKKRPSVEIEFEAFMPCKIQSELELESNYFSTTLAVFSVEQL